jgi:hypothetical protein
MYNRTNEDVAWERIKDLNREAENRRLVAAGGPSLSLVDSARNLAQRAWVLAGLAMSRPPRRHPQRLEPVDRDEAESAPDAA